MKRVLLSSVFSLLVAGAALAQQGDGTDLALQSNVWKPLKVPVDDARVAQLQVPPGFAVNVFARGLGNTRVIAVVMPNENGIEADPWQKYIVTVNELERSTGYRFFSALPPNIQTALKAKRDAGRKVRTRTIAELVR